MWDLARFSIDDLESCSAALRGLSGSADTLEGVAQHVVETLHEGFINEVGTRQTALVRFYKTHRFAALPADLQDFAARISADVRSTPATPCLTLLASTGVEPAWRDRRRSAGHQAIPIPSSEAVTRLPMVAKLLADLGLEVETLTGVNGPDALQLHHRSYDVFYVPEAAGSPWVPAQDFVRTYGIRSVVGLGGVLPSGDLYALLLFSVVKVEEIALDGLRPLASAVKAAVIRHTYDVFR